MDRSDTTEDGVVALTGIDQLWEFADQRRPGVPVACAGAADPTVIEALGRAQQRGWVQPVLAGRADEVRAIGRQLGIDPTAMRIIDTDDPAVAAVTEVRAGRASVLMKGQVATPALMRAVLDAATGLRTGRTICQVVLMDIRPPGRRFLLADTGVTIEPTLEQKADILDSAIDVAHRLGVPRPRVALLAATEKVTDSMPDTLDSAELVRRAEEGSFPESEIAGPLSFDLAYAPEAGRRKGIGSTVVGAAEAMLFPNLLAANLTVKAIMHTADCRYGGVLCGADCPIAFMSRADSTETRLNSLALALALLEDHTGRC